MNIFNNIKHMSYLHKVIDTLDAKYNFDPNETIQNLKERMDTADWILLANAMKYPNRLVH